MDSHHMEQGDSGAAGKPCLPRHKCRTCERTRSIKVRVLTWIVGKISLILVIIVTSGFSTFLYHKILPDDGRIASPSSSSSLSSSSSATSLNGNGVESGLTHAQGYGVPQGNGDEKGLSRPDSGLLSSSTSTLASSSSSSSSYVTAARLLLSPLKQVPHLQLTKDESQQFFTSGDVRLDNNALLILKPTTLFISADVILKSMTASSVGARPSTVIVCLSLVRFGDGDAQKPISCQTTYLRELDQQLARVWILLPVQTNDRIYVNASWPSYVINSDSDERQQSVFTAFEVGHMAT